MLTSFKEKSQMYNVKKHFKKEFQPDPRKIALTKQIYLTEFSRIHQPVTNSFFGRIPFTKHVLAYSIFSFSALAIIGTGVWVYADRANVGPTHILYPIKRANENLQVILSKPEDQPGLHYHLAERRFSEIKSLQRDDSNVQEKIKNLSEELDQEIDSSLLKISELEEKNGQSADTIAEKKKLCKSIAAIIDEHKKLISNDPEFKEDFSGFSKNCSKVLEQNNQ